MDKTLSAVPDDLTNDGLVFNCANVSIAMVDCGICNKPTNMGCVTAGNHTMCSDCFNEFNDWMYTKLIDEWVKQK